MELSSEDEAMATIKRYMATGQTLEQAKRSSIICLRRTIEELGFIDVCHMIGLKPRVDFLNDAILKIIEK